jgi:hypothetical protein
MDSVAWAVPIGIGATIGMDIWAVVLRMAGVKGLDYAMVGRWLSNMPRGQFVHARIAAALEIRGERAIGWIAHYAIGVALAALLILLCGPGWVASPRPLPAIAFGIATVAVSFLVMQPAMGLGVAASRTPAPRMARLRSVATHAMFGLGLYASALIVMALRENSSG